MSGRTSSDTFTIYRCTVCKRWSHAKKQPKSHERKIGGSDLTNMLDALGMEEVPEVGAQFDNALVVNIEHSGYVGDPNFDPWSVVTLACGPFEKWTAVRDVR